MKKALIILLFVSAHAEDYVHLDKSHIKPVEAAFMGSAKTVVLGAISAGGYWVNGKYQKYKTAMQIAETAKNLAQARKARALAKQKSKFSNLEKGFKFTVSRKSKK